jgi:hypothetical protein
MAKEEQAKPFFPATENKESRFCPVQTIAGFAETTAIQSHADQQLRPQHTP